MPALKQHIVQRNETLIGIAARYGFPDYRLVFQAACNVELRKRRNRPELIQPGDRLLIPPNPAELRVLLTERLQSLRRLRAETMMLFDRIDEDLDRSFKNYKVQANTIDYVATTLRLLTGMVGDGFRAMSLTGAKLGKANEELAKAALKFAYKPIYEVGIKQKLNDLGADDDTQSAFGVVARSFADLTTPSFWAHVSVMLSNGSGWSKAVSTTPLQLLQDAKARVHTQRDAILRGLDQKIDRAQQDWLISTGDYSKLYDPKALDELPPHARL